MANHKSLLFLCLLLSITQGFIFHNHQKGDARFFTKSLGKTASGFQEKYLDQKLDHFNFKSNGENVYKQRYLINEDFWKGGSSPIFFYTGNEGDIESFKDASGFVTSFGEESGALIVFAEHRYYGKSLPFGEQSFDDEKIGLLTIEQAMADFATLMLHLKKVYNAPKSPIITYGGSYGGQLAAYMRIRYPNIVSGALSASAPLYWITGVGDSHGFWESVTNTFSAHGECGSLVRQGFHQVQSLADAGNYELIGSTFNVCQKLDKSNYKHFLGWLRNAFTDLAMMNYPYKTNFLAPLPGHPVEVACNRTRDAQSAITGLAGIASLYYGGGDGSKCFDMMSQYVECSDPTGCGLGNDAKAWDYQACTEIILPGGTNGNTDMFPLLPFTPEMRAKYCQDKYGVSPRPDWIRMSFWTDKLQLATNIIFSNGDLDPWGPGGINSELSSNLPIVKVVGGAHHFDLRGDNDADPASVTQARRQEKEIIKSWIKNSLGH